MTNIVDRYAGAVHSANLKSRPDTTQSDSDVLGAAGLAGIREPLAMALLRLFVGDSDSAADVVGELADLVCNRADLQNLKPRMRRVEAEDMARAVLAWHRDGICAACDGHGYSIIPGTLTVGDDACQSCHGTRKVPFDRHFSLERLDLARWLLDQLERELGRAGPAAMAALAPRLDLG